MKVAKQSTCMGVQKQHIGVSQLLLQFNQKFRERRDHCGSNNSTLLRYTVRVSNNNIFQEA